MNADSSETNTCKVSHSVCVCGVCDDAHTVIHIQMVYADMYMYM